MQGKVRHGHFPLSLHREVSDSQLLRSFGSRGLKILLRITKKKKKERKREREMKRETKNLKRKEIKIKNKNSTHCSVRSVPCKHCQHTRLQDRSIHCSRSIPRDTPDWAFLVQGLQRTVKILLHFWRVLEMTKWFLCIFDICIDNEYLWSAHTQVACQFWTQIRGKFLYSVSEEA